MPADPARPDALDENKTSDAVQGDLYGTPGEWPERQPMTPSERGTPHAQPARGRQSDALDEEAVEAAQKALRRRVGYSEFCDREEADAKDMPLVRLMVAAYLAHTGLVPRAELEQSQVLVQILREERDAELEARRGLRAELERAERERDRLREREAHFARVLGVADGGQYRNDWDAAIQRVIDRAEAAEARCASIAAEARRIADWIDRDRREPDKVLAYAGSLRAILARDFEVSATGDANDATAPGPEAA